MKLFNFTFILMILFSSNIFCQTYYLNDNLKQELVLDSSYFNKCNSYTNECIYNLKNINSYYDNFMLTITYSWVEVSETWVQKYLWLYEYDTNNNPIQMHTAEWDNTFNRWDTVYKVDMTYNADGLRDVQLRNIWVEDSSKYLPYNRFTWNYNDNELVSNWIFESTSDFGISWNKVHLQNWSYNENQILSNYFYMNWNNSLNQWDSLYKYNFHQDSYENTFQDTVYKWENAWVNYQLCDISYDEDLRTINCDSYDMTLSGEWRLTANSVYHYSKNPTLNTMGIKENALKLYPNPTDGIVSFDSDFNENYYIQIIDLNGHILLNRKMFNANSIDMDQYEKGIYIIRFISDEKIISKKIIKN